MAECAIRREPGSHMRRIRGSCEVRFVAVVASCRQIVVVVAGVALRALHCRVCARQGPVRIQGVIKVGDRSPGQRSRTVACIAGRGEAGGHVARIIGAGEVGLVATVARSRNRRVVVIRMTGRTSECGVRTDQWEY